MPHPEPIPMVPVGVDHARMIKALADQALAGATDPMLVRTLELMRSHAERIEAGILRRAAQAAR